MIPKDGVSGPATPPDESFAYSPAPAADGEPNALETVLEDYLTRLDAGEEPDREEYLRRFPELAEELRRFFEDVDFLDARLDSHVARAERVGLGRWYVEQAAESELDPREGPPLPRVKGFQILEELGSGGQGVVYKARQLGTQRTVALKVIREGLFASTAERRRFENEIELASRLNHPNVVSVYACGQEAGRDYFAMQFVEGDPLDVYLSRRQHSVRETLDLFLPICSAVSYAHLNGVIHRDLKPSNVLVDARGVPHILDFGLAKAVASTESERVSGVTQVGHFAGTWYYASPEQAEKDPARVDIRSDVYALGVILYEMLTGELPYPIVDQPRETVAHHIINTPPTPPSSHRPEVDAELETIIFCALQKDPQRRYQSAAALADDLERYLAGEAIAAKRDSHWYVLRKTLKRYRWRVTAGVTALAALVVFAAVVSLLYAQAISARATTDVRTRIVRNSQRYLVEKLDELNWAANRLAEIAAAHPSLPEVAALERETIDDPFALISPLVEQMPDGLVETVRNGPDPSRIDPAPGRPPTSETPQGGLGAALGNGRSDNRTEPRPPALYAKRQGPGSGNATLQYQAAVEWLTARDAELAHIAELAREKRFVFSVDTSDEYNLLFKDRPGPWTNVPSVCDALTARAWVQHRAGDTSAAAESLDAARSIAVDLADGRSIFHKLWSLQTRDRIYSAILCMLAQASGQNTEKPYIDWILRDPPLVEYRLSMISERQRMAQLSEEASFGKRPGEPGYLNFDTLYSHFSAGYPSQKEALAQLRALAQSISPDDAMRLIDDYIREVERWERIPSEILTEHAHEVINELSEAPAWKIVAPLFGTYSRGMAARAQIIAKRSAAFLAARMCQYRINTGRWPEDGNSICESAGLPKCIEPSTGQVLGIAFIEGTPSIYRLTQDGVVGQGRKSLPSPQDSGLTFFPPSCCPAKD